MEKKSYTRNEFIRTAGAAMGGAMLASPLISYAKKKQANKTRIALVGTGVRGVSMYGRNLLRDYGDYVEMVGICDINPGRLRYASEFIGAGCPTYTDFDQMLNEQQPETLIVTTEDSVHHKQIIRGMELGCNIISEKPITIDEYKAQAILDAEKKYGKQVIVTFNYRYPPYRAKIKELIMNGMIGDVTSVDFHWNITHSHLMRYMQRWHGERNRGGTLWVHKSTHHFDMVNWFIDSEPLQVQAYGTLERFGRSGPFRGRNCRNCNFTDRCKYHWDITQNDHMRRLYVENEHYDGYIRDNCVFREQIDAYDKHAALVKYANGAFLNYSLTADTEHEGYWLAFDGTEGRLEVRSGGWPEKDHADVVFMPNRRYSGENERVIQIERVSGGHWGGDPIMNDKLFKDPDMPDPLGQQAGTRDGVMSILIGIAARKSVETGKAVDIEGLTELKPMAKRPKV